MATTGGVGMLEVFNMGRIVVGGGSRRPYVHTANELIDMLYSGSAQRCGRRLAQTLCAQAERAH